MEVRTTLLSTLLVAVVSPCALLFLLICVVVVGCPKVADKGASDPTNTLPAQLAIPVGENLGASAKLSLQKDIPIGHGLYLLDKDPFQDFLLFKGEYPSNWPSSLIFPEYTYLSANGGIQDISADNDWPLELKAAGIIKVDPKAFRAYVESCLAADGYTVSVGVDEGDEQFYFLEIKFDGRDAGIGNGGHVLICWGDLMQDMLAFLVVTMKLE
jgi:hypothetical protein